MNSNWLVNIARTDMLIVQEISERVILSFIIYFEKQTSYLVIQEK